MIMRPYAIQNDIKAGLKKYFGVVTDDELMNNIQLNNELYNINNLPLPETDPWITKMVFSSRMLPMKLPVTQQALPPL